MFQIYHWTIFSHWNTFFSQGKSTWVSVWYFQTKFLALKIWNLFGEWLLGVFRPFAEFNGCILAKIFISYYFLFLFSQLRKKRFINIDFEKKKISLRFAKASSYENAPESIKDTVESPSSFSDVCFDVKCLCTDQLLKVYIIKLPRFLYQKHSFKLSYVKVKLFQNVKNLLSENIWDGQIIASFRIVILRSIGLSLYAFFVIKMSSKLNFITVK